MKENILPRIIIPILFIAIGYLGFTSYNPSIIKILETFEQDDRIRAQMTEMSSIVGSNHPCEGIYSDPLPQSTCRYALPSVLAITIDNNPNSPPFGLLDANATVVERSDTLYTASHVNTGNQALKLYVHIRQKGIIQNYPVLATIPGKGSIEGDDGMAILIPEPVPPIPILTLCNPVTNNVPDKVTILGFTEASPQHILALPGTTVNTEPRNGAYTIEVGSNIQGRKLEGGKGLSGGTIIDTENSCYLGPISGGSGKPNENGYSYQSFSNGPLTVKNKIKELWNKLKSNNYFPLLQALRGI